MNWQAICVRGSFGALFQVAVLKCWLDILTFYSAEPHLAQSWAFKTNISPIGATDEIFISLCPVQDENPVAACIRSWKMRVRTDTSICSFRTNRPQTWICRVLVAKYMCQDHLVTVTQLLYGKCMEDWPLNSINNFLQAICLLNHGNMLIFHSELWKYQKDYFDPLSSGVHT